MKRLVVFTYGVLCYILFFGVFLYWIGFLGGVLVPKSVDSGVQSNLLATILWNGGLILLFGLPHSLMARQWFKRKWTRIIPSAAERSTYVLVASIGLALLMWQWHPMPVLVWQVEGDLPKMLIWGTFWLGSVLIVASTWMINHFDLFGLRQVYGYWRGQAYAPIRFQTPYLYRFVRHPMQLGIALVMWATPAMSWGHLFFASGMTAYMLVGLAFEESDLLRRFGVQYRMYQEHTPMLIPWFRTQPSDSQILSGSKGYFTTNE